MEATKKETMTAQVILPLDLFEEVLRRANAEGISLSAWMRRLVIREIAP